MLRCCTSLMALFLGCISGSQYEPEVKSPAGTFRGKIVTSFSGADYASYKGIPYALPPTGERRFALPAPYPLIEGVYDARDFGSACLQNENGLIVGKEDCLYLNVYTPFSNQDVTNGDLKKVYVFIHGGALFRGSSNLYLPGDLVTKGDIVVVTLNYRLHWLGFLRGNSSSVPGNAGFYDQLLALQWVRDNIRSFGGDPSDVTLSGESAGSMSTSVLSVSPLTKYLFTKAVLLSGTASVFQTTDRTSNDLLEESANKFGCGQEYAAGNEDVTVACLRKVPSERFALPLHSPPFSKLVSSGDDMLPKGFSQLLTDQDYLHEIGFFDRDYLVSFTSDDGYIFINSVFAVTDTTSIESSVEHISRQFTIPRPVIKSVLLEYLKLYGELEKAVTAFYTDNTFLNQSLVFLEAYSLHPRQEHLSTENNAYFMCFDHKPRYVPNHYVLHAIDLVYLFDLSSKSFIEQFYFIQLEDAFYEEDRDMKSEFLDVITDFLKTGNPGVNLAKRKNVVWPAYNSEKKSYLNLSLQPSVGQDIMGNRRELWEKLRPEWLEELKPSETEQEL